jgi:hypothetical protein
VDGCVSGQVTFCDLDSVNDFFDAIDGALQAAQAAYDLAITRNRQSGVGVRPSVTAAAASRWLSMPVPGL